MKLQPFEIFEIVHQKTGVTRDQIRGVQKTDNLVIARCMFSIIARQEGYSHSAIGRHINRDHSTVMAYFEKTINRIGHKIPVYPPRQTPLSDTHP
jgi:chromosomal replication initiation ATPase DnaA